MEVIQGDYDVDYAVLWNKSEIDVEMPLFLFEGFVELFAGTIKGVFHFLGQVHESLYWCHVFQVISWCRRHF